MRPDSLNNYEFDGDGHIRNWGPGILKNQLHFLQTAISNKLEQNFEGEVYNNIELHKLRNDTLYIPDYVLNKWNGLSLKDNKKHDEKELFEDYKHKYKIVSLSELNQKIIEDTSGFFYFLYIKSSSIKYINVINSLTGEIIYSKHVFNSYNLKSSDIKDLQMEIDE